MAASRYNHQNGARVEALSHLQGISRQANDDGYSQQIFRIMRVHRNRRNGNDRITTDSGSSKFAKHCCVQVVCDHVTAFTAWPGPSPSLRVRVVRLGLGLINWQLLQ